MKLDTATEGLIQEFYRTATTAADGFREAGRLLVKILDERNVTLHEIAENIKGMSVGVLERFEQLGRNRIHPSLMLTDCPAANYIHRLPIDVQTDIIENGVDVVVSGKGVHDVLHMAWDNLTECQRRQAIDQHGKVDAGRQRAWIEDQATREVIKSSAVAKKEAAAWAIHKGKLIIHRACEFSIKELARIVAEAT